MTKIIQRFLPTILELIHSNRTNDANFQNIDSHPIKQESRLPVIKYQVLPNDNKIVPPTVEDGEMKLNIKSSTAINIPVGNTVTVSTGLILLVPKGYYADIFPVSSHYTIIPTYLSHGFRQEVKLILRNETNEPITFCASQTHCIAAVRLRQNLNFELEDIMPRD